MYILVHCELGALKNSTKIFANVEYFNMVVENIGKVFT